MLRPANVVEVLQRKRGLLTDEDVETCKGGMNTWGFVGDLNDHPQLSCVYQSDDAQNEFLSNPKVCTLIIQQQYVLKDMESRYAYLLGFEQVPRGGGRRCVRETADKNAWKDVTVQWL